MQSVAGLLLSLIAPPTPQKKLDMIANVFEMF